MPLDILFIEPRSYVLNGYLHAQDFMPSLGLMHLLSYIKKDLPGMKVRVLDPVFDVFEPQELGEVMNRAVSAGGSHSHEELAFLGLSTYFVEQHEAVMRRLGEEIERSEARFVAIPFNLTSRYAASVRLARMVKSHLPDTVIIVGGNHASCAGADLLHEVPEIDVLVRGEGELALAELLTIPESESMTSALASIRGIIYRDGDEARVSEVRPEVKDLDLYPNPYLASDEFRLDERFAFMKRVGFLFSFDDSIFVRQILTSRGCPFGCEFCTNELLTERRVRFHSVDYVRDVALYLKQRWLSQFPAPLVNVTDAIFAVNRARTSALNDALRDLGLHYQCQTHTSCLDDERLSALKEMGMKSISFGIESFSPAGRRTSRKELDPRALRHLVDTLHQRRIRAVATFIVGLPGDGVNEVIANAYHAVESGVDEAIFFPLVAVPGSRLYSRFLEEVPSEERERVGNKENREYYYTAHFNAQQLDYLAQLSNGIFACRHSR